MTAYTVQYILPCEYPEGQVRVSKRRGHMTFEVPVNYPNAHKLTLMDLIAAQELSGLFTVSPTPNRDTRDIEEAIRSSGDVNKSQKKARKPGPNSDPKHPLIGLDFPEQDELV